jgi:hypothetical protein
MFSHTTVFGIPSGRQESEFPRELRGDYQRLTTIGERCYPRGRDGGNPGNRLEGSIESQGEMHSETNFADFRLVTSSLGIKTICLLSAKIEKMGSRSCVTTKANNPLISSGLSKIIFRWPGAIRIVRRYGARGFGPALREIVQV